MAMRHATPGNALVAATILLWLWAIPSVAWGQTCGEIMTFADGLSPSQELHVDLGGSDVSGDGSPGNPYATILFAASQASPGTAIVVHPGTYAGGQFISNLEGTPLAPIWVGGAPGAPKPIIEGGSSGLALFQPKYVVVHDLEIRSATTIGLSLDDGGDFSNPLAAHHVVLRDLSIHDIGTTGNQDCLKLSGINEFFVLSSDLASCPGQGIDMVGCHQGVIAGCELSGPMSSGIQAKGGSEDIEIVRNRVVGVVDRGLNIGGSTGIAFFRPPASTTEPNAEARNIRAIANVLENGMTPVAFVGAVDSVFSNNTVVGPDRWLARILQETTSSGGYEFLPTGNNDFENNIVHYVRADVSFLPINIGADTAAETFGFANNLWFASDDPANSAPNLPAPELNGLYGQDPAFQDLPMGDFHLSASSPAIASGMSPAHTDGDFDGACFASPPSIGAFEGAPPAVPILGAPGLGLLVTSLALCGVRRRLRVEMDSSLPSAASPPFLHLEQL